MLKLFNKKKETPAERQLRIKLAMLSAKRDHLVREYNKSHMSQTWKRSLNDKILDVDYQMSILRASEGLYSSFPDYLYDGDPESLAEKNFIINGLLDKIVELEGYSDGTPSEDRKIMLIHELRSKFEVKMNPNKKTLY